MSEEQAQAASAPGQQPGQEPDSADSTKLPGTPTVPDSADSTKEPGASTSPDSADSTNLLGTPTAPDSADSTNAPGPVDPGCTVSDDEQRFAALKNYVRVDFDDDDPLLSMLLAIADDYLVAAGIDRELAPAAYDLASFHMVSALYDGRETDAAHAAATPAVRQIINQLKIRCAIASQTISRPTGPTDPTDGKDDPDGSTSSSGTAPQPDNRLCTN